MSDKAQIKAEHRSWRIVNGWLVTDSQRTRLSSVTAYRKEGCQIVLCCGEEGIRVSAYFRGQYGGGSLDVALCDLFQALDEHFQTGGEGLKP